MHIDTIIVYRKCTDIHKQSKLKDFSVIVFKKVFKEVKIKTLDRTRPKNL